MANHPLVLAKRNHAAHLIQRAYRRQKGDSHQARFDTNNILAFIDRSFAPDIHGNTQPFSAQRSRRLSLEKQLSALHASAKTTGEVAAALDLSDTALSTSGAMIVSQQMAAGALRELTYLNLGHNNIGALSVDRQLLKERGWVYRRHKSSMVSTAEVHRGGGSRDARGGKGGSGGGGRARHKGKQAGSSGGGTADRDTERDGTTVHMLGQRVYCKRGIVQSNPPHEAMQAGGLIDFSKALCVHEALTILDLSFNKLSGSSLTNNVQGIEGWGRWGAASLFTCVPFHALLCVTPLPSHSDASHYTTDTHGIKLLAEALMHNHTLTTLDISHCGESASHSTHPLSPRPALHFQSVESALTFLIR
jgi:hypothetical protein